MLIEQGKTLYQYALLNGNFVIREGIVNVCGERRVVNFSNGGSAVRCPEAEDIGQLRRSSVPVLWLTERDDELARQMFIGFENRKIVKLLKQIEECNRLIGMLNSL